MGLDYGLIADLGRLAPTGPGNADPLIVVGGLTVTRVRAAAGGHTQLTLKRRLDVIDGIAFGWTELAGLVVEGDRLDVVARPVIRSFGGYESLQLEIRDAAPAGSNPGVAARLAGGADLGGSSPRPAPRPASPLPRGWADGRSRPGLGIPTRTGRSLRPAAPDRAGRAGHRRDCPGPRGHRDGGPVRRLDPVFRRLEVAHWFGRRRPRGERHAGALERGRDRSEGEHPGQPGLRQGRQHLDPDGRPGAAADEGRRGIVAGLVVRWQVDLLHRDDRPAGLLSAGQFGPGAVHDERAHPVPDLARRANEPGAAEWPLPQRAAIPGSTG